MKLVEIAALIGVDESDVTFERALIAIVPPKRAKQTVDTKRNQHKSTKQRP